MTDQVKRRDDFERTFAVEVSPEAVWQALTRQRTDDSTIGAVQYHVPGFEARCSVLEEEPLRLLRMRKDEEPCSGTEIAIRLEHAGSGTRVTVVQSGFGPWLPDVIETFGMVWNMIVADLKLYVERGVSLKSHLFDEPPPRLDLGCGMQDRLEGLAITSIDAGGFAARAGLREGDVLVKLNGARLLNGLQLLDLMRMCAPGNELEAVWVRGRELTRGSAPL